MSQIAEALKDATTDEQYNELTAFDTEDPKVKKFMAEVAELFHSKEVRLSYREEKADKKVEQGIIENKMLTIFAENINFTPKKCSKEFEKRYGEPLSEKAINMLLEYRGINNTAMLTEIFNWASDTVIKFEKALKSGEEQDCKNYLKCFSREQKKDEHKRDGKKYEDRSLSEWKRRIFCIVLFQKHRELFNKADLKIFEKFGEKYASDFSFELNEILMNICGVQKEDKVQKAVRKETETLKNSLKRNEMEFDSLKNDFEEQLQERLQDERIKFFAMLNSEKYGCILDEVINALNGKNKLRKQNVTLPLEINGLFVLVEKIAKFVRDNEINPIMKMGAKYDMTVGEIEAWNAEYIGNNSFENADERKHVKVISPGWFYKDKDIQISRPKLQEYVEEDSD